MQLVGFSVQNYRSITKAHKLKLGQSTVLIGPNNEGKSNVLNALVAGLKVLTDPMFFTLQSAARHFDGQPYNQFAGIFDWHSDFPIHLQESKPDGKSVLTLEFQLTDAELGEFQAMVHSKLNGLLPIKIELGRMDGRVTVHKQGKGGVALTKKSQRIARFVSDRLVFDYVPAVRTAGQAQQIVDNMVERELRAVESNPRYRQALREIEEVQAPILKQISENIRETLTNFLPAVTNVEVSVKAEERYRALRRSAQIVVDDGTPTLLKYKGDGVKSLAALGMMRLASASAPGRSAIVAIEEPESHLHPSAIHRLRSVIRELAAKDQVVLTTHCPLFVNRGAISTNILVHNNRAKAASSVKEVRELLGVRASDNLSNAEVILFCEGEDDCIAMRAILSTSSVSLGKAIDDGTIALEALRGASNLSARVAAAREMLCTAHCLLDDDQAGHTANDKALAEGLVEVRDVHFTNCPGLKEAELEDWYDPAFYAGLIKSRFGVEIGLTSCRGSRDKWSDRMKGCFRKQGRAWSERTETDLKLEVARLVRADAGKAIRPEKAAVLDSLIKSLEERLAEMEAARVA